MKKTIAGIVLLASAAATAEVNLAELAKENGLNVACVAAAQQQGRMGTGYVLSGGTDLTAANQFFHRKLKADGCAEGQIQILTAEEVQMAVTPVML